MNTQICQTLTHSLEYLSSSEPIEKVEKPLVVLVPGMLSGAVSWSEHTEFMRMLLAETSACLAISLRGRGGSSSQAPTWGPEEHGEDLDAVVNQAKFEKFVLCGHSAGAAYALSYALSHPHKVSGLIIGDYFPCHFPLDDTWIDSVSDLAQKQKISSHVLQELAKASQMINYAGRLGELKVPILVIRGTEEGAVLEKDAVGLYAQATDLKVVEVPGGHEVFARSETTAFVKEWLQALSIG